MTDETRPGRRISVHEATVQTATVEIRTLTVSGKQVTLAVFRQLIDEDLLAFEEDNLVLQGLPWGRVNYHPEPKRCPGEEHIHVVWQAGDELRRAAVPASVPREWRDERWDISEPMSDMYGYYRAHKDDPEVSTWPVQWGRSYLKRVGADSYYRREATFKGEPVIFDDFMGTGWSPASFDLRKCLEWVEWALNNRGKDTVRWRDEYRKLRDLDQLFIAV